jgi:hypothetical protein
MTKREVLLKHAATLRRAAARMSPGTERDALLRMAMELEKDGARLKG